MNKYAFIVFCLMLSSDLFSQGFATFKPITPGYTPRYSENSEKVSLSCVVRYMTNNGWSDKYNVDVIFIHGIKLNEATNSMKYSTTSIYGVIFWSQDQSSVIKLSTPILCYGTDVNREALRSTAIEIKGKDETNRDWKICAHRYCM